MYAHIRLGIVCVHVFVCVSVCMCKGMSKSFFRVLCVYVLVVSKKK